MKLLRDKRASRNLAYTGEPYKSKALRNGRLHRALLVLKMYEEVGEIAAATNDVYEYADLIEATLELAIRNGISLADIERARAQKRTECGGFARGIFMYRDGAPVGRDGMGKRLRSRVPARRSKAARS